MAWDGRVEGVPGTLLGGLSWRALAATDGNPLLDAAMDAGQQVVAYTCSYVPTPLLAAGGLVPLRVRASHAAGTPLADTYLSSVLCPYPRGLLEGALEGQHDALGGWVFAASCDAMRRLADNLAHLLAPAFLHVLDLPHKRSDDAVGWYTEELRRLAAALSAHFGVDCGPGAIVAAIEETNALRAALRAIGELRRRESPPLSGAEFLELLLASVSAPARVLLEPLESAHAALAAQEGLGAERPRLLVIGSQLDDPAVLRTIESQGAVVVADRFCFGSQPGLEPLPVDPADPLPALAEHYLRRTVCPRMMDDFPRRVNEALALVERYEVDGVVLATMTFCDLWGVETPPLAEALRAAGVPVLRLTREYARTGEGQLRTRVQAFLESLDPLSYRRRR